MQAAVILLTIKNIFNRHDISCFMPNLKTLSIKNISLYYHEVFENYNKVDENGRRYSRLEKYHGKRMYLDERKGTPIGSIWIGKSLNLGNSAKERLGYPTQKPLLSTNA